MSMVLYRGNHTTGAVSYSLEYIIFDSLDVEPFVNAIDIKENWLDLPVTLYNNCILFNYLVSQRNITILE